MAWQEEPFRFLNFKECLPDKLRFWVYLLFLFVFQFSNGMYFTAMSQMQGEQSISINDVKMMSHAVLIGLTLYFPLAFRLKFRFTNRTSLIIASTGLLQDFFASTERLSASPIYCRKSPLLTIIPCFCHLCSLLCWELFTSLMH